MEVAYSTLQDYINIALTISTAFIGVGFALFTLFYAFIGNKKDELKNVNEEIKNNNSSMSILRRRNSNLKFIVKMKSFNRYAITILLSSILITLTFLIIKLLLPLINELYYKYIILLIAILSLYLFIILSLLVYKMLRHYNDYTNL